MTIHDDFDELASAYLDGEATADEIARVESDPALMAQVQEFRLLANAVAAPVILPDEGTRQAAIASAIDASGATFKPNGSLTAPVASLDAARAKRQQRNSRLLSIAAVFAAVAVGGAIIWSVANSGGDDETASTMTEAASDTSSDSVEAAADDTAASAGAAMADADDAMMDDAMMDEAMEEEAMEEEVEEAAVAEIEPSAATADETRLGDDDDAAAAESAIEEDAEVEQATDAAEDAVDGGSADADGADADGGLNLVELFGFQTSPDVGLFAIPVEERADYLGIFDTTEELAAAAAEVAVPSAEPAPLGAADCPSVVGRLVLADATTALGTAHLVDPVTGLETELALLTLTTGNVDSLIAIGLEDCRLFIGQDQLP